MIHTRRRAKLSLLAYTSSGFIVNMHPFMQLLGVKFRRSLNEYAGGTFEDLATD